MDMVGRWIEEWCPGGDRGMGEQMAKWDGWTTVWIDWVNRLIWNSMWEGGLLDGWTDGQRHMPWLALDWGREGQGSRFNAFISNQCFYSVSFCSQTIKMEQGKKGATESSNDWVPSVFIPALPSPHLVSTVPGSKHHNTQNNRIGESTEGALEPPWPFRPLLPLEDAIQKTTSDHLSKALTVLMLNMLRK